VSNRKGLVDWLPLINKLVWPVFILVALLIFHRQVAEIYEVVVGGMKEGRSVEIGGFLKLGDAATRTSIGDLAQTELSIAGVGGAGGVARKGGRSQLQDLQRELEANPQKTLNTLLLPDDLIFLSGLMKEYVSTLGLQFVVFQRDGRFDGWIRAGTFVAQLPEQEESLRYAELRDGMVGVSELSVRPEESAREVLARMQEWHLDSVPVVDADGQWLFFANRGEILSRLMSSLILAGEE